MAVQLGTGVRNARLDAIETSIGTGAILTMRTGSPPANCAAANSGTVLATLTLPSDWMGGAGSGVKSLLGTWQDTSADNTGTAAHYRIHDSGGTVCGVQGTVGPTGGTALTCATTANNTSITAPANSLPNGINVSGTGILAGTYVVSGGGTTTLVLSLAPTLTNGSVSLTFTGDMTVDNPAFVATQGFTITAFSFTDGNA
jgi:hypothetical protein